MRSLFEEGRTLAAEGRLDEAVDRFERSLAEQRTVGALLNLGDCLEKLGQPARAHARFVEAEALAQERDAARVVEAHRRVVALETRIAVLVLGDVGRGARVTIDGSIPARFKDEVYVEPGRHAVTVARAGGAARTVTMTLKAGERATLAAGDDRPDATPQPVPATKPETKPDGDGTPSPTNAIFGWTGVGVGTVGIALGAIFGASTISKKSDLEGICPRYPTCPIARRDEATSLHDSAATSAAVSTVGFVVGGALVATGIVLLVAQPIRVRSYGAGAMRDGRF